MVIDGGLHPASYATRVFTVTTKIMYNVIHKDPTFDSIIVMKECASQEEAHSFMETFAGSHVQDEVTNLIDCIYYFFSKHDVQSLRNGIKIHDIVDCNNTYYKMQSSSSKISCYVIGTLIDRSNERFEADIIYIDNKPTIPLIYFIEQEQPYLKEQSA